MTRLFLVRCLGLMALFFAGCTSAPNLIGVEPDEAETGRAAKNEIRIYVATTRAPSEEEGVFFSGMRSGQINFATVDVSVPPAHVPGQIELPSDPPPDADQHFVFGNPQRLSGTDAFMAALNKAAGELPRGRRSALIFIHGYNTNTTEAVARFAQLVEDTGYEGVPILFTWPSARRAIDYVTDLNSTVFSRDAIARLAIGVGGTKLENYDIVAHSMGNFLMMESLRTLSYRGEFALLDKLSNVIMAAPDIDIDVFASQLNAVPSEERHRLKVLVSRDDKALRASRRISGNRPRLGATDPDVLSGLGVTIIDLTEIKDTSSISHSKFADSPDIVQIIGERLAESDTLSTQTTTPGVFLQRAGNVINVVQLP